MFTIKHYKAVTTILRDRRSSVSALGQGADTMLRLVAKDFFKLFREDNKRFDSAEFCKACGLKEKPSCS